MSSFVSSFSLASILRQTIASQQAALSNDEVELTTNRYADVGLTLGGETGQSLALRSQESLLETITASNNSVSTNLSSTQNILTNLQSTAQNFLQTLIQSNTGNSTALQVEQTGTGNLQSFVQQLNTNVSGQYIFGGINSSVAPMNNVSSGSTAVTTAFNNYLGSIGATASTITPAQMQSFLSSSAFTSLFQETGTPPDWNSTWSNASDTPIVTQISPSQTVVTSVSANQSAFQDLAQAYSMVANLSTSNLSSQTYQTVVSAAEASVQSALTGLTNISTNLGVSQNAINTANDYMSTQMATLSTQIGNLENVDTFSVSTQATALQTQIETAYALTSQIQQLSLTKFL